jgi:hypothetical protein
MTIIIKLRGKGTSRMTLINDVTVAEGGSTGIWSSFISSSSSFQSVSGSGVELSLKYNVDLCQINTIEIFVQSNTNKIYTNFCQ